jgi:hypothetical protein
MVQPFVIFYFKFMSSLTCESTTANLETMELNTFRSEFLRDLSVYEGTYTTSEAMTEMDKIKERYQNRFLEMWGKCTTELDRTRLLDQVEGIFMLVYNNSHPIYRFLREVMIKAPKLTAPKISYPKESGPLPEIDFAAEVAAIMG